MDCAKWNLNLNGNVLSVAILILWKQNIFSHLEEWFSIINYNSAKIVIAMYTVGHSELLHMTYWCQPKYSEYEYQASLCPSAGWLHAASLSLHMPYFIFACVSLSCISPSPIVGKTHNRERVRIVTWIFFFPSAITLTFTILKKKIKTLIFIVFDLRKKYLNLFDFTSSAVKYKYRTWISLDPREK